MELAKSMLHTICNNKEKIKKNAKVSVPTSTAKSSFARSDLMEKSEKMLSIHLDLQNCNVYLRMQGIKLWGFMSISRLKKQERLSHSAQY